MMPSLPMLQRWSIQKLSILWDAQKDSQPKKAFAEAWVGYILNDAGGCGTGKPVSQELFPGVTREVLVKTQHRKKEVREKNPADMATRESNVGKLGTRKVQGAAAGKQGRKAIGFPIVGIGASAGGLEA